MAIVKISGHSDDLIEVEGAITDELSFYGSENGDLLAFSDGTVLRVIYNDKGIWRITPVAKGSAIYSKDENPEDDDRRYSDIVTLDGDIQWVVHRDRFVQ